MIRLSHTRQFRGTRGHAREVIEAVREAVEFLSKNLNEVVQSAEFKKRMLVLGMAPPPAAENTPERFDKFMREEIARQGEMAEQSGQKLKPPPK